MKIPPAKKVPSQLNLEITIDIDLLFHFDQ